MSWQPIQTAPKDGTLVLLFADGAPCFGHYNGPSDGALYAGTASQYEWFIPAEMSTFHNSLVTHWMPLPPPPEEDGR
jgi:hypothetical protein